MVNIVSFSSLPEARSADIGLLERDLSGVRVGIVTHYMPPHIGGIELVAESLFGTYLASGLEARWIASRVPAGARASEGGRLRVGCWNLLERRLGVPWPVWGPAGMRELARLIDWADLLHVHDCLYLGSMLTSILARRAARPVILSQHVGFIRYRSAVLNGTERLAFNTVGRAVLKRADQLVFSTPAAEEFVTELLGGRPPKATTIPNGIDTERFRPATFEGRLKARRELGLPDSKRVVLFVGRLVEKKGVDLVLEAARRLLSYHFLIVGSGPLEAALPRGADNLTWLPFVAPERMDEVYRAADVFLLPSHGEGLPLSIQEAMATAVPVIISRGEPFSAPLEREEACLAVERTPEAICQALVTMLDTPAVAEAIAGRSRQIAERSWSLRAMGARYLSLICDLAARR